jgi:hypothetical protein
MTNTTRVFTKKHRKSGSNEKKIPHNVFTYKQNSKEAHGVVMKTKKFEFPNEVKCHK